MERLRILLPLLAVACLDALSFSAIAQAPTPLPAPPERQMEAIVRPAAPFSLQGSGGATTAVELRSRDRMTAQDRKLAEDWIASIGEHARFAGAEFDRGTLESRQVACSAMPDHLFLRFSRVGDTTGASLFTASIPRGAGSLRILPIHRRGYSALSPGPVKEPAISTFNRIRDEERSGTEADWLATGLCFAALEGAELQPGPPSGDGTAKSAVGNPPSVLQLPSQGGATIRIADAGLPRPMEWAMTFDRRGRLLKVALSPASMVRETVEHPQPVDLQGKPIREEPVALQGRPIQ
jgi:hypothetical protein